MELPARLRQGVDSLLNGVALTDLQRASDILSKRYRAETRDGRLHLSDEMAAYAYLAARLPATYAAVFSSLDYAAELRPEFSPVSLLDVGAGPGTVLWAASQCWPDLRQATLMEASNAIRTVGSKLSDDAGLDKVDWVARDIVKERDPLPKADLVTLAYVLDELSAAERSDLIARLWSACENMFVLIEPGTPAGWQRIKDARSQLTEAGAFIVAPCPHHQACAIEGSDWCHFSRRVARSKLHRLTKQADVPWEDEKYIYLAVSRYEGEGAQNRVLAPVKTSSGKAELKLCRHDGGIAQQIITKRDGDLFKKARRADWGDVL
ncbi:ribosomal protein RSM22 (predicted rRNA methylase) [Paenochrobactrum gallinarii]|uniref:Ribosomal protein RSM22 (Predicted rRNA methylase) n=1 Tax=Paenochrobactrum gallinarii TaxID=643673 RepID=A0A841LP98_9HYPH|nr:small ribosomal subunit Rsm22 family protein [Paenochrobactrum gallinarii]MBB6259855.1 ribosomal protein RSM22 (predicted rRNA methylase) [Paenochrobactrum gallinarii]